MEITVNDRLSAAALISFSILKVRRLFQLKGNVERTQSWARKRTNMHTSNRYMNVIWSRKFPYIKTLELTSGSGSCLSSNMVLISFYIKRRNKGREIICKSNLRCGAYSRAAFIREAALNRSFTVTSLFFVKKGKK